MKQLIEKVIGYVRVSSESQKDNTSVAEQKKRIYAYCTSQYWKIKEIYIDEAKPGSKIDERIKFVLVINKERNSFSTVLGLSDSSYLT